MKHLLLISLLVFGALAGCTGSTPEAKDDTQTNPESATSVRTIIPLLITDSNLTSGLELNFSVGYDIMVSSTAETSTSSSSAPSNTNTSAPSANETLRLRQAQPNSTSNQTGNSTGSQTGNSTGNQTGNATGNQSAAMTGTGAWTVSIYTIVAPEANSTGNGTNNTNATSNSTSNSTAPAGNSTNSTGNGTTNETAGPVPAGELLEIIDGFAFPENFTVILPAGGSYQFIIDIFVDGEGSAIAEYIFEIVEGVLETGEPSFACPSPIVISSPIKVEFSGAPPFTGDATFLFDVLPCQNKISVAVTGFTGLGDVDIALYNGAGKEIDSAAAFNEQNLLPEPTLTGSGKDIIEGGQFRFVIEAFAALIVDAEITVTFS